MDAAVYRGIDITGHSLHSHVHGDIYPPHTILGPGKILPTSRPTSSSRYRVGAYRAFTHIYTVIGNDSDPQIAGRLRYLHNLPRFAYRCYAPAIMISLARDESLNKDQLPSWNFCERYMLDALCYELFLISIRKSTKYGDGIIFSLMISTT